MFHNVYFWLHQGADDSKFEKGAQSLFKIDVVKHGTLGKLAPTPERPVTDKTFQYHLCLEFSSIEDHNTYQQHHQHHQFVEDCSELWSRVVVYDSEPV
ncbi:MAG: Dabb family protein [Verrucomicrobiaceae bacterium]|nr:Dabb family protein [Verrucomicrobiaceae bacterium]